MERWVWVLLLVVAIAVILVVALLYRRRLVEEGRRAFMRYLREVKLPEVIRD